MQPGAARGARHSGALWSGHHPRLFWALTPGMKRPVQLAGILFLSLLILALVEAQFHFLRNLFGRGPLGQRELATYSLGRRLAAHFPGKTALVLSNPFSQKPVQPREIYYFKKASWRGLARGMGTAL